MNSFSYHNAKNLRPIKDQECRFYSGALRHKGVLGIVIIFLLVMQKWMFLATLLQILRT